MAVTIPKQKYTGAVREVVIGATEEEGGTRSHTVTVGGETTLPFLFHEGDMPNPPRIAVEIADRRPKDWSPLLFDAWGDVVDDLAAWAKAAEATGADLILLKLTGPVQRADGSTPTIDEAREAVRTVLEATGLPLMVFGPGQVDLDNELLVAVAEEGDGERLVLGVCEDKNYRTIVAAAIAHGHLVDSRTPMDVNLSKQLVILVRDVGLSQERILMDPSTGALGYGIEYGYSVMERLRLAALSGDAMTQQPMLVTPGEEAWKLKESKVGEGVPEAWGDWAERSVTWEVLTATTLLQSGADIVVLRHPESVKQVHATIERLMTPAANGT
ncbi:MAG: acetyl-CoA decarbonylase/synthase complex subunit delta [Chloroflexota bacterium]|nr:acetyl-CoA decarbonylase/synthase complex subunit delta [Chloroflexota bacterium]